MAGSTQKTGSECAKEKKTQKHKKFRKQKLKKKHETQNETSFDFLESYNEQVSRGYNTLKPDRFRDENRKKIGKKESENRL